MIFSILICTMPEREGLLIDLMNELDKQIDCLGMWDDIEVIFDYSSKSIGAKRNELLDRAEGKYVAFIDDDDMVTPNYIDEILKGIEKDVDCISLRGIITWDGSNPEIFEHSIKYKEWKTNSSGLIKYERCPNHLNVIKRQIAEMFRFPDINHGEDRAWSEKILNSGLIRTEHFIDKVLYHYQYLTK